MHEKKEMNYNAGEEVVNKIKRERKTCPETSNKINVVIESLSTSKSLAAV